jgi:glycosyltransferase involved in cell wall biosynthesis
VVAPVPWFPFKQPFFGRYALFAEVPSAENRHNLTIFHPRYPVIPKIGMTVAPFMLARAMRPVLRRLLQTGHDFDAIDAHYFYPDGVAAVLLGRYFGKPVVVTARGTDINLITRHPLARQMITWTAKRAAANVAVSHALKNELIGLGISDSHVTVLRNGVDLELFYPSDRYVWRNRLGIKGVTLLCVGHLTKLKGHDIVLTALTQLPEIFLLIVGGGEEKARLQTLARSLKLSDRVRFIDEMSQEGLRNYYSASDVLVLASSREGWPNVLLEAMACGTPVIATNVGGVPEIVSAPEAGLIMQDRTPEGVVEAIHRLFAKYPSREATRRYAERFDWNETTEGQAALFKRVISQELRY